MANCGANMFYLWINFFCNTCNWWVTWAVCNTAAEHGENEFQFSNENKDDPALKFCGRINSNLFRQAGETVFLLVSLCVLVLLESCKDSNSGITFCKIPLRHRQFNT